MHHNWMRDYDPTTGRYIQADPLGLVDGASVYGYALQSPGRYTDPTGEFIPVAALAAGFAFGALFDFVNQIYHYGSRWECIDIQRILNSGLYGAALSTLGPTGALLGRGGAKAAKYGYGRAGLRNRGNTRFGWSRNPKTGRDSLSFRRGNTHRIPDLLPGPKSGARPLRDGGTAGLLGTGMFNTGACTCEF